MNVNLVHGVVVALSLALLANAAVAADVNFQEHVILTDAWGFPSDNDFVGDVDGDGDADVVSCTRYSGAVWWFQNSGGASPTFTTRQIDTHGDCRSVYAADLDGDGHTDLLSASAIGGAEVRWYKNNGAATPSFTKRTIPTTAVDFFSVSSADLNGDGRMDILTGAGPSGPSSNQLAWHENKGGNPPTFVEHQISRSPAWPHSVKVTDLNGDGELDLVVGFMWGQAAAWYENNGASTPSFVQHMLPTPAGFPVVRVDVGDINNDGAIDIALALNESGGGVAWLKSSGGAAPVFARYAVDISSSIDALAVSLGDVDGDGDLDMFASPRRYVGGVIYTSDFAWYENLGGATPTFTKHTISTVLETPDTATALGTNDVLAADFNGDGKLDVLAREDSYDYPARLMWYENLGATTEPVQQAFSLCPGDINADGIADLAMINADGNAKIKNFNGALVNQFTFSDPSLVAVKLMPDINGNGAPELVGLAANSHKAEVFDTLTGAKLATVAFNTKLKHIDVEVVADQNGNGVPEVAALGQGSGKVEIKDALTSQLLRSSSFFGADFHAIDLAVYDNLVGDGSVKFGVLGENNDPNVSDKLSIRDLATGANYRTLQLGKGWTVQQQAVVNDMNGNGTQELAVMRVKSSGAVNVTIRDSKTTNAINSIGLSRIYAPYQLLIVPDINGNGSEEVVVYGKTAAGEQAAQLRDSKTGEQLRSVWFNKNFPAQDVATCGDNNGNGAADIVVLGKRASDGKLRAMVQDSKTGALIKAVDY